MCKHIVSITYVILHAIYMRVCDIYKANSWYILVAAMPLYIYALKGHISTVAALLLLPCCPCRPFQVQGHLRRIFFGGFRAEHMQELTTSHSNIYLPQYFCLPLVLPKASNSSESESMLISYSAFIAL